VFYIDIGFVVSVVLWTLIGNLNCLNRSRNRNLPSF